VGEVEKQGSRRLVLAGGGHAHLTVITGIPDLLAAGGEVTVVGPGRYHYYSGMGPGLLGGMYHPYETRLDVKRMVEMRGGTFVEDRVISAKPDQRVLLLSSGAQLPYDLVSFNLGSKVTYPPGIVAGDGVFPAKPVEGFVEARRRVIERAKLGKLNLWVAGGGAAGVELAANLRQLVKRNQGEADIFLVAGEQLLERFPSAARTLTRRALARRKIEILEGVRVAGAQQERLTLSDGTEADFDLLILAIGTTPAPFAAASGLAATDSGALPVDEFLRAVERPEIFGAGDCVEFAPAPLQRIGVHPVKQGPVLLHNLKATLRKEPLKRYKPRKRYLQILSLGDGSAVLSRGRLAFSGKWAYLIKDNIDCGFLRRFRSSAC